MAENGKLFEIDNSKEGKYREVIKVVGVGGGGNNALNHIISSGLKGVEFIAANTDVAQLNQNLASIKIVLGEQLTKGKGAGSDPEIGFKAAKESADMIKEILQGADMVFITAGMGGGTGTGASPVIAEVAKETGALVVAVVTKPFIFEGKVRIKQALEGIKNLQDKVDALIVIPNDKLLEISDKKMALLDSFKLADEVLRQAVQGVTDLILRPGLINVDFADVRAVMSNAGSAIMGIGEASGEDRAVMAAKAAINSPLMETPMQGAKGILFNVTGGNNVGIHEIKEAAQVITEAAAEDAIIIWGHVLDPEMDDKLQITVIATGFSPVTQQSETSRGKSMSGKKRSRVDLEEAEVKVPEEDLFRISGVQVDTFDLPTVVRRKKKE
ncbi:MAG TPA: cell division protein FtsZ [Acetomicrobium flavidum]|uniref:Cell division protein FtsZ n=1 Tax=Acetomicrobium mobile (strain ATCC BAA-54 / DSM 13181 / JCM 12221 / NGA) TaxID=891968 RepID=I4BW56_ACEMN|nr:cell division protein FtsZ [Acetomicrobium mobile]AFM21513.1 cell division protein FtsZ [Acetomicrobium mobile DSM 13181]HPU68103.1 cell division protein FtsZ [Acetomicrobium flavidum]